MFISIPPYSNELTDRLHLIKVGENNILQIDQQKTVKRDKLYGQNCITEEQYYTILSNQS